MYMHNYFDNEESDKPIVISKKRLNQLLNGAFADGYISAHMKSKAEFEALTTAQRIEFLFNAKATKRFLTEDNADFDTLVDEEMTAATTILKKAFESKQNGIEELGEQ